jgi:hypothetical protein
MVKKIITALVLLSFTVSFTLPARNRRIGGSVRVALTDGSSIAGELCAINRERITISLEKTEYVLTRPLAEVESVQLIRNAGKKVGRRGWVGGFFGCMAGYVIGSTRKNKDYMSPVFIGLGTTLLGAIIWASFSSRRGDRVDSNYLFQNQSEDVRAAAINELDAQARDPQEPR